MGPRQTSPWYHYPSCPGEGEEAAASSTCPPKGQKLPEEGVQKVPGRHPPSRVSPNPAGELPLPLLTGNTATSALQTSRGRPGQSCCCPASWKEKGRSKRVDLERARRHRDSLGRASPCIDHSCCPGRRGLCPFSPAGIHGHTSPGGGLPPSEAFSPPLPPLNPAQAALAEALDPAAESGFLHSQSLLDFSSLLLRNKDKLETVQGIQGRAWLLKSPLTCLHHRPPFASCSSSVFPL